jgi:glycosyltransferase involved in cell wall biosynthesis
LNILACESFDAGSHRAVRQSISRHSRHEWTWLTRPGRAWKWRMRLAALEMIEQAQRDHLLDKPFNAVFTTSLISVSDLRAALPPAMCCVPVILYMHENQAAYPAGEGKSSPAAWDANYALTNLTSILAADCVIWNSWWNRQSFAEGIATLLRNAPDGGLLDERIERSLQRSVIIWPPVECENEAAQHAGDTAPSSSRRAREDQPVRVVWPHRWEHDKGPDELLAIARQYTASHNLRWTILGESFQQVPPAMQTFLEEFAESIDHAGYVKSYSQYSRHLQRCDWVLSTARHEYYGIAVVEAMLRGCLPWLPDRLSYPELLPHIAREISPMNPPDDPDAARAVIREHLQPAVAPNAVVRIDAQIESMVASHADA